MCKLLLYREDTIEAKTPSPSLPTKIGYCTTSCLHVKFLLSTLSRHSAPRYTQHGSPALAQVAGTLALCLSHPTAPGRRGPALLPLTLSILISHPESYSLTRCLVDACTMGYTLGHCAQAPGRTFTGGLSKPSADQVLHVWFSHEVNSVILKSMRVRGLDSNSL